jgi:hypothetical protein
VIGALAYVAYYLTFNREMIRDIASAVTGGRVGAPSGDRPGASPTPEPVANRPEAEASPIVLRSEQPSQGV